MGNLPGSKVRVGGEGKRRIRGRKITRIQEMVRVVGRMMVWICVRVKIRIESVKEKGTGTGTRAGTGENKG